MPTPLTTAAATWIRTTVLVYGPTGDTVPPKAGGPCACQTPSPCQNCLAGFHQNCHRTVWTCESAVYGPGLSYEPRARVWLADRVCKRPCPCKRCGAVRAPSPAPATPLAQQLDLFA